MFALTTPVAESYPANLLFAILLAYYIEPKKLVMNLLINP